jgi:uncharacterized protein DUF5522/cysteine-rich CWC protein
VKLADFHNPNKCPLCGAANECQLCSPAAYKGPCWCAQVKIPDELIAQVPLESRNKSCICRACVMKFHREKSTGTTGPKILPGDFYFDGGMMVFNAAFHLRRGYCCDSGCRHCPYRTMPVIAK